MKIWFKSLTNIQLFSGIVPHSSNFITAIIVVILMIIFELIVLCPCPFIMFKCKLNCKAIYTFILSKTFSILEPLLFNCCWVVLQVWLLTSQTNSCCVSGFFALSPIFLMMQLLHQLILCYWVVRVLPESK